MNIVLIILVGILCFGVIIFVHELGHFIVAKLSKVTVLEFSIGMGPKIFSWGKTTKYSLRALPVGGFVRMEGEDEESESEGSFNKAPIINRILIILAGAFMNLVLGFIIILIIISSQDAITSRTIAKFEENAITQQTGLQVGDTLYSLNGRRLLVADDLFYEMIRVEDGIADITVIRDGEKVELENVQFKYQTDENGNNIIQVDFWVVGEPKTVGNVLSESGRELLSTMRLVWVSLIDILSGRVAVSSLSGPVGIVAVVGEALSVSFMSLLNLMALITVNLGIFNLLPIPALDGGKLWFLAYEGITKKKPNPKVETALTLVGMALLIGLMLFVTFNDITRLFS